ncbi:MAG: EamA family transporter, partial [Rhodobacterales bacterium]
FGEPVDGWVVLGGVVIMTAVSFIAWREAVVARRRKAEREARPA